MKVGIIGAGRQGGRRAEALKQAGDELILVADSHPESARRLAADAECRAVADWEAVTSHQEIEVVVVCTPPDVHLPICLAAIAAGKHVLCEKPLAMRPSTRNLLSGICITNAASNSRVRCGFWLVVYSV